MLYVSMRLLNGNLISTLPTGRRTRSATADLYRGSHRSWWSQRLELQQTVSKLCSSGRCCQRMCIRSVTPANIAAVLQVMSVPHTHLDKPYMPLIPIEIGHFYLYMGPSKAGYKYLLLTKDDLSEYLWLVPNIVAKTATTVCAQGRDIMRLVWRKFGYPFLGPSSKTW
jgi:hypothetical protein